MKVVETERNLADRKSASIVIADFSAWKSEEDRRGCLFANNGNAETACAALRGGAVNAVESLRRCEQNRLPNDFIFATTAERERTPRLRRPAEGTAMHFADEVALSLLAALRHLTCAPSKSGDGWMSVYWRREILRSPLYGLAISPAGHTLRPSVLQNIIFRAGRG